MSKDVVPEARAIRQSLHGSVVAVNAALTTAALIMLLNTVDRQLGALPVGGTAVLTLASLTMVVLIGGAWLRTAVVHRQRRPLWATLRLLYTGADASAPSGGPCGEGGAQPQRGPLWGRERLAKVVVGTACYTAASVLLRVVALLLTRKHFAGGDMSALLLVLPCAIGGNALLRATLLDPLRRRRRAAAVEARRQAMTPLEYGVAHDEARVAALHDTKRSVALLLLLTATLLVYYPATLDVPAFDRGAVLAFAASVPALLGAGALAAVGDVAFELYATNFAARNDRAFALNVAVGMTLCNGAAWLVVDAPMGGHFFGATGAAGAAARLPVWWLAWPLGADSVWRLWLWFAVLCVLLAAAALAHCVSIVVTASAAPGLYAAAVAMTATLGVAMLQQQPPLPSLMALVYYVCGVVTLLCAVYVDRWSSSATAAAAGPKEGPTGAAKESPQKGGDGAHGGAAKTDGSKTPPRAPSSSAAETSSSSKVGVLPTLAQLLTEQPMAGDERQRARQTQTRIDAQLPQRVTSLLVDVGQGFVTARRSIGDAIDRGASWLEAPETQRDVDFQDSDDSDGAEQGFGARAPRPSLGLRPVTAHSIWQAFAGE